MRALPRSRAVRVRRDLQPSMNWAPPFRWVRNSSCSTAPARRWSRRRCGCSRSAPSITQLWWRGWAPWAMSPPLRRPTFSPGASGTGRVGVGRRRRLPVPVSVPFGTGLAGTFDLGLIPHQLAVPLVLVTLGALVQVVESPDRRWVTLAAVAAMGVTVTPPDLGAGHPGRLRRDDAVPLGDARPRPGPETAERRALRRLPVGQVLN